MKPSNFQLIDKPRVTKNIFEINKEFNLSGNVKLEIDNEVAVAQDPNEDNYSLVILNLKFFADNDFKDVPFKLEVEIEGTFSWDNELAENTSQLETLLNENAPAILYSYLRPIITNTSVEANLPPLVIPLMNFRE